MLLTVLVLSFCCGEGDIIRIRQNREWQQKGCEGAGGLASDYETSGKHTRMQGCLLMHPGQNESLSSVG